MNQYLDKQNNFNDLSSSDVSHSLTSRSVSNDGRNQHDRPNTINQIQQDDSRKISEIMYNKINKSDPCFQGQRNQLHINEQIIIPKNQEQKQESVDFSIESGLDREDGCWIHDICSLDDRPNTLSYGHNKIQMGQEIQPKSEHIFAVRKEKSPVQRNQINWMIAYDNEEEVKQDSRSPNSQNQSSKAPSIQSCELYSVQSCNNMMNDRIQGMNGRANIEQETGKQINTYPPLVSGSNFAQTSKLLGNTEQSSIQPCNLESLYGRNKYYEREFSDYGGNPRPRKKSGRTGQIRKLSYQRSWYYLNRPLKSQICMENEHINNSYEKHSNQNESEESKNKEEFHKNIKDQFLGYVLPKYEQQEEKIRMKNLNIAKNSMKMNTLILNDFKESNIDKAEVSPSSPKSVKKLTMPQSHPQKVESLINTIKKEQVKNTEVPPSSPSNFLMIQQQKSLLAQQNIQTPTNRDSCITFNQCAKQDQYYTATDQKRYNSSAQQQINRIESYTSQQLQNLALQQDGILLPHTPHTAQLPSSQFLMSTNQKQSTFKSETTQNTNSHPSGQQQQQNQQENHDQIGEQENEGNGPFDKVLRSLIQMSSSIMDVDKGPDSQTQNEKKMHRNSLDECKSNFTNPKSLIKKHSKIEASSDKDLIANFAQSMQNEIQKFAEALQKSPLYPNTSDLKAGRSNQSQILENIKGMEEWMEDNGHDEETGERVENDLRTIEIMRKYQQTMVFMIFLLSILPNIAHVAFPLIDDMDRIEEWPSMKVLNICLSTLVLVMQVIMQVLYWMCMRKGESTIVEVIKFIKFLLMMVGSLFFGYFINDFKARLMIQVYLLELKLLFLATQEIKSVLLKTFYGFCVIIIQVHNFWDIFYNYPSLANIDVDNENTGVTYQTKSMIMVLKALDLLTCFLICKHHTYPQMCNTTLVKQCIQFQRIYQKHLDDLRAQFKDSQNSLNDQVSSLTKQMLSKIQNQLNELDEERSSIKQERYILQQQINMNKYNIQISKSNSSSVSVTSSSVEEGVTNRVASLSKKNQLSHIESLSAMRRRSFTEHDDNEIKFKKMAEEVSPVEFVNIKRQNEILNFLFNKLNQASMLCKLEKKVGKRRIHTSDSLKDSCNLSRINIDYLNGHRTEDMRYTNTKLQFTSEKPSQYRNSSKPIDDLKRKTTLKVINISESFFKVIPHYDKVKNKYNQCTNSMVFSTLNEKSPSYKFLSHPSPFQQSLFNNSQSNSFKLEKSPITSGPLGKNDENIHRRSILQISVMSSLTLNNNSNLCMGTVSNKQSKNSITNIPNSGYLHDSSIVSFTKRSKQNAFNGFQNMKGLLVNHFQLDASQTEMLELKMFQPYLISNRTIIEYQRQKEEELEKLSIMDILEKHFLQKKKISRLFFKVNASEDIFISNDVSQTGLQNSSPQKCNGNSFPMDHFEEIQEKNESQILEGSCSELQYIHSMIKEDQDEEDSQIIEKVIKTLDDKNVQSSKDYTSTRKGGIIKRSSRMNSSSSPQKTISNPNILDQYYDNNGGKKQSFSMIEDNIRYYEFDISNVDNLCDEKDMTLLNIQDVTLLIKNQMKFSDQMYQNAIENNYSHEQMTPLNCIIGNSAITKKRLLKLYSDQHGFNIDKFQNCLGSRLGQDSKVIQQISKVSNIASDSLQIIASVEQSAKAMWYYNQNQISRMKIKKNQLRIKPTTSNDVIGIICSVLWPFEFQIQKNKINLYVVQAGCQNLDIICDWKLYELILFNIVQNAVKYNKVKGDILIILRCKQMMQNNSLDFSKIQKSNDQQLNQDNNLVFETEIVDTGVGINIERQKLLFIPFLELKCRQGVQKKENESIGLGLSASQDIVQRMDGDIRIKQSERGLTVFQFKIPAKAQVCKTNFSEHNFQQKTIGGTNVINKLVGSKKYLSSKVTHYLQLNKLLHQGDSTQIGCPRLNTSNNLPSSSNNYQERKYSSFSSQNQNPSNVIRFGFGNKFSSKNHRNRSAMTEQCFQPFEDKGLSQNSNHSFFRCQTQNCKIAQPHLPASCSIIRQNSVSHGHRLSSEQGMYSIIQGKSYSNELCQSREDRIKGTQFISLFNIKVNSSPIKQRSKHNNSSNPSNPRNRDDCAIMKSSVNGVSRNNELMIDSQDSERMPITRNFIRHQNQQAQAINDMVIRKYDPKNNQRSRSAVENEYILSHQALMYQNKRQYNSYFQKSNRQESNQLINFYNNESISDIQNPNASQAANHGFNLSSLMDGIDEEEVKENQVQLPSVLLTNEEEKEGGVGGNAAGNQSENFKKNQGQMNKMMAMNDLQGKVVSGQYNSSNKSQKADWKSKKDRLCQEQIIQQENYKVQHRQRIVKIDKSMINQANNANNITKKEKVNLLLKLMMNNQKSQMSTQITQNSNSAGREEQSHQAPAQSQQNDIIHPARKNCDRILAPVDVHVDDMDQINHSQQIINQAQRSYKNNLNKNNNPRSHTNCSNTSQIDSGLGNTPSQMGFRFQNNENSISNRQNLFNRTVKVDDRGMNQNQEQQNLLVTSSISSQEDVIHDIIVNQEQVESIKRKIQEVKFRGPANFDESSVSDQSIYLVEQGDQRFNQQDQQEYHRMNFTDMVSAFNSGNSQTNNNNNSIQRYHSPHTPQYVTKQKLTLSPQLIEEEEKVHEQDSKDPILPNGPHVESSEFVIESQNIGTENDNDHQHNFEERKMPFRPQRELYSNMPISRKARPQFGDNLNPQAHSPDDKMGEMMSDLSYSNLLHPSVSNSSLNLSHLQQATPKNKQNSRIQNQHDSDNALQQQDNALQQQDNALQQPSCDCQPKILIVDDVSFNILTLSLFIQEKFKIKPEEATSGITALQMYKKSLQKSCMCNNRTYKLIFMDIQMPEMDGIETAQKMMRAYKLHSVKQQKRLSNKSVLLAQDSKLALNVGKIKQMQVSNQQVKPDCSMSINKESSNIQSIVNCDSTHIVALTAFSTQEVIDKCMKIGMKRVMDKPFNPKEMEEVMMKHFYRIEDDKSLEK